jgi:hypothetical protein
MNERIIRYATLADFENALIAANGQDTVKGVWDSMLSIEDHPYLMIEYGQVPPDATRETHDYDYMVFKSLRDRILVQYICPWREGGKVINTFRFIKLIRE